MSKFFKKIPSEVYPLVGAVAGACSLATYYCFWNLTNNPDVSVSKKYAWQTIDPKTHHPHVPFLAGRDANFKIDAYREDKSFD